MTKEEYCLPALPLLCLVSMKRIASSATEHTGAKGLRHTDFVKLTIFGFAIAALWNSMYGIILPLRVLDFAAGTEKILWIAIFTLSGYVLAMIVQPISGAISDRSGFSWGQRRPFILIGVLLAIIFIFGMGFAGSLIAAFVFYCLLQISTNGAQGPWQGLFPDFVPEGRRGQASGVKGLLELVGGFAIAKLVGDLISGRYHLAEGTKLWVALGALAAVMLVTMIITVLTVKERPGTGGFKLPPLSTLRKSFRIDVKAQPNFVPFLISRLLFFTPLIVVRNYGLFFFKDVAGVPEPEAAMGNLIFVVGVSVLAVVYPAGHLSDRIGRRPVAIAAGFIGALGIVFLFFYYNYAFIILASCLLGISYGTFISANWAMAMDLVIGGEEARYLGLTNLATAGSGILVALLGLATYFLEVDISGWGYKAMLLACCAFFIVSSLILLKIKAR